MKDSFGNDLLEPAADREPYFDRPFWGVYAVADGSRFAGCIKSRMTLNEANEEAAKKESQPHTGVIRVYRVRTRPRSFKPGRSKPAPR